MAFCLEMSFHVTCVACGLEGKRLHISREQILLLPFLIGLFWCGDFCMFWRKKGKHCFTFSELSSVGVRVSKCVCVCVCERERGRERERERENGSSSQVVQVCLVSVQYKFIEELVRV